MATDGRVDKTVGIAVGTSRCYSVPTAIPLLSNGTSRRRPFTANESVESDGRSGATCRYLTADVQVSSASRITFARADRYYLTPFAGADRSRLQEQAVSYTHLTLPTILRV